jgi:hypothetical protein
MTSVLNESERKAFDLLLDEVKRIGRGGLTFEFQIALSRTDGNLNFVIGVARPNHPQDPQRQEEKRDYGDLLLRRWVLKWETARDALSVLAEQKKMDVPDFGTIDIPSSLETSQVREGFRQYSGRRWGLYTLPWPCRYFNFRLSQQAFQPPRHILARPGLPPFGEWYEAVGDFFGVQDADGISNHQGFAVVLYDFRARIREICLSSRRIDVAVESRDLSREKLVVQVFARRGASMISSPDLLLDESGADFEAPFEPTEFAVALLERERGELVDNRKLNLRYRRDEPEFHIRTSVSQIADLLMSGEGPTVEFKESLTDKEKVLRTIAAFANTSGGTLVLGVDDHGLPVRSIESSERDRLTQMIGSDIEPPIEPVFEAVHYEGRDLILIHIPPGEAQPHVLRGRGIFVRRGATSRQISKAELEEMIASRKSNVR